VNAKARTASTPPHYSHPVWLLDNDPQHTFDLTEASATRLASTNTVNSSTAGLSTPKQQPQNPSASLASLLETFFVTLPSIPHINASNSAHLHYPVFVPKFTAATSCSPEPPSITSCMPICSSTAIFAETLTTLLTSPTRCPPRLTPPRPKICTGLQCTRQMSPHPSSKPPLRKSWRLLSLPPSHSPLQPVLKKDPKKKGSPASSNSSGTSTPQSLQDRLRASLHSIHSSLLTHESVPPSGLWPMGLSPLFATKRQSSLRNSRMQNTKLQDSRRSTSSESPTSGSCELNWASSQFPMALNVTRAESPPLSQQEEAKWWS
jgi:hypothetical protein